MNYLIFVLLTFKVHFIALGSILIISVQLLAHDMIDVKDTLITAINYEKRYKIPWISVSC
ncbi:MAG: hypothetical protein OEZ40_11415 [Candidatus Bathyarchaeota archaeon]|nr:hypothetical protein [Candidatus Bathyarchaeota archaeon]